MVELNKYCISIKINDPNNPSDEAICLVLPCINCAYFTRAKTHLIVLLVDGGRGSDHYGKTKEFLKEAVDLGLVEMVQPDVI